MKSEEKRSERNAQLVKQCLTGNTEASDALIIENLPLVKETVKRVLNRWPGYNHLRDELLSEGEFILTKVVREMTEPPVSFHNLAITAMRNAFLKIFQGRHQPYYAEHRLRIDTSLDRLPQAVLARNCEALQSIEDREFLLSLCVSERERQVLSLYLEGGTPTSIAHAIRQTVAVVKHTMSRYRKRAAEMSRYC